MSNQSFRSGPWLGFYNYNFRPLERHRMDLDLTFLNGSMTGAGIDDVGRFLTKGRYDSKNGECYWTKSYIGAHDVFYRGFREWKGIWGTWEIGNYCGGGFHICPRLAGEWEQATASAEAEAPVDAIATEVVTVHPSSKNARYQPKGQHPTGGVSLDASAARFQSLTRNY